MKDLTIRELQTQLPWTIHYSQDFRAAPLAHKDFAHTMHHVSKAAGKLHGLADDMDHDRTKADTAGLRDEYAKYIADLVVCAMRLANVFPGGVVDLQRAVEDRIENKNGVTLHRADDNKPFVPQTNKVYGDVSPRLSIFCAPSNDHRYPVDPTHD